MNPGPRDLIPAIVSYVVQRGSYVTKTKLLKLLYLCDVEYYRIFRRLLTGFQWKFFHLGPWTREFDPLLKELIASGVLAESRSRTEFETRLLETFEEFELAKIFGTLREETPVKRVLDRWAESSTGEILDYVYFYTEPMEHGIRNEPLDFTSIAEQAPSTYTRQASGKTPKEIAALRKRFQEELAKRRAEARKDFAFTPPRYDEEFIRALIKLDSNSL